MNQKTLLALSLLAASAPGLAVAKRPLPQPAVIETPTLGSDNAPAKPQAPVVAQPQASADAAIAVKAVAPTALPTAITAPAPVPAPTQDEVWRKVVLGTWQAVDNPESTTINGETTFTPDGKAAGYTTATYLYGSGNTKEVRIGLKFNWKIVDGVLILDHYESDPPDFFPKTHARRFEIKSLSATGAVLRDLIDDQEVYRRRKPG